MTDEQFKELISELMPINQGINEINAGIFDMVKKSLNQSLIRYGPIPELPGYTPQFRK
jgi:hypothetical protein